LKNRIKISIKLPLGLGLRFKKKGLIKIYAFFNTLPINIIHIRKVMKSIRVIYNKIIAIGPVRNVFTQAIAKIPHIIPR
jgi:hypothetical protein